MTANPTTAAPATAILRRIRRLWRDQAEKSTEPIATAATSAVAPWKPMEGQRRMTWMVIAPTRAFRAR